MKKAAFLLIITLTLVLGRRYWAQAAPALTVAPAAAGSYLLKGSGFQNV